jgi:hypothetical protein
MPCGGQIAVDTPGYEPCDDCQSIRAITESPQCDLAEPITSLSGSNNSYEKERIAEYGRFAGWLVAGGRSGKTARETVSRVKKAIEAGAVMPDEVTTERFPNSAKATLDYLRSALSLWGKFKRGEKLAKRGVPASDTKTVKAPKYTPTIEEDPEVVQEEYRALVAAIRKEIEIIEAEGTTAEPQAPVEADVEDQCNGDATVHTITEIPATTSTVIVPAEIMPVPEILPTPVVDAAVPLDEPTILLPIPVSWIDSVSYDRDGCEAWAGFEEPLKISTETADEIVRLMREGSP